MDKFFFDFWQTSLTQKKCAEPFSLMKFELTRLQQAIRYGARVQLRRDSR